MNHEMKRIRNILGSILAVCILALVLLGLFQTAPTIHKTKVYQECIEMGFSPIDKRIYDCVELLTMIERLHRIDKRLDNLLNPGIEI